jgi:DnaD/phage-associated family protein
MTKTKFVKRKNRDIYLFSTEVENLFINELMPDAPGEYVKVYLIGLMCAENGIAENREKTANILGIEPQDIDDAWHYWESQGAVTLEENGDSYDVVFLSQREAVYGSASGKKADSGEENRLADMELKALFTTYEQAKGAPVSGHETGKIADAVNVYGITPDVFSYAIKYCAEMDKTNIDYIFKVALNWKEEGCRDIAQVRELLDRNSKRNTFYRLVFREIGFDRRVTPADREMMDRWFDDMGFSIGDVLEACRTTAGMREPSLRYVNRVLENKYLEAGGIKTQTSGSVQRGSGYAQNGAGERKQDKGGESSRMNVSRKVLEEYYAWLRAKAEKEQRDHMSEVIEKVPLMGNLLELEKKIEENMISFDFSDKAKERRKLLRSKKKEIEEEKKKLLEQNGFPADYLDVKYRCELCRDTGILENGGYCRCTRERAEEAYRWNREKTAKKL